jgi:hypothetical protein
VEQAVGEKSAGDPRRTNARESPCTQPETQADPDGVQEEKPAVLGGGFSVGRRGLAQVGEVSRLREVGVRGMVLELSRALPGLDDVEVVPGVFDAGIRGSGAGSVDGGDRDKKEKTEDAGGPAQDQPRARRALTARRAIPEDSRGGRRRRRRT